MREQNNKYKIAAVVVTYNGLAFLKECLTSLRNQIHKLDEIFVINNFSTDGTLDWLNSQKDLTVITQKNRGGAGGFHTGIKTASEKGFDWIWCLDHDIISNVDTLSYLIHPDVLEDPMTGFLASIVLDEIYNPVPINIPQFDNNYNVIKRLYSWNVIPIICCSFSSVLLNSKVVKKIGLPFQDFFVWGDDSEYTLRIIEKGYKGYLIPKSFVIHKDSIISSDPFVELDIKSYKLKYGLRNFFYVNKLKNRILYKSTTRAWVSSFYFYFKVLKGRFSKKGIKSIAEALAIIQLIIQGIFFKPKK
jgi:rhamnopyranosyl-N-acetylglucosaminyl-diphospho-decaprenol beta-1,3/1,4-galactofuranosyltransferase